MGGIPCALLYHITAKTYYIFHCIRYTDKLSTGCYRLAIVILYYFFFCILCILWHFCMVRFILLCTFHPPVMNPLGLVYFLHFLTFILVKLRISALLCDINNEINIVVQRFIIVLVNTHVISFMLKYGL